MDPITKELEKKPMKPFMVGQLQILLERDSLIMSPYDELLHKQLIDYEVERMSASGQPVFTSENEHFVDALGLAYLAFVLEFTDLTNTIKRIENSTKIMQTSVKLGESRVNSALSEAERHTAFKDLIQVDTSGDLRGDRPTWYKTPISPSSNRTGSSWGTRRTSANNSYRSSW
mgnify:CR=1 FL=1